MTEYRNVNINIVIMNYTEKDHGIASLFDHWCEGGKRKSWELRTCERNVIQLLQACLQFCTRRGYILA
jgi:hypothetical protein